MSWQADTASGYRDLLGRVVQLATSKYLDAVAINNAGTGYTVGDILTITHAGAAMNATLEVLTAPAGVIGSVAIRNMGAFSDRAASATVSAGGTGYAVGDILQVQGGTYTQRAKFQVATLSGSAVATVTLFDGGGAYTSAPSNPASTTKVGPAAGTGSGCTLTLSMTGLIGSTGIAATGGTGASATFNLTLDDAGWTAVRDENDYTFNSITDEKEVILLGTVAGGDAPYVGFRSYTATVGVDTRYGIVLTGFDDFNDLLSYDGQPGMGPKATPTTDGSHWLSLNTSMDFWCSVSGRRIVCESECQPAATLTFQSMYVGLALPYATATENPYPMVIAGSSGVHNRAVDAAGFLVTGLTEAFGSTSTDSPIYFRKASTGLYQVVANSNNGTKQVSHLVFPVGETRDNAANDEDLVVARSAGAVVPTIFTNGICDATGAVATNKLFPALGTNESFLIPATIVSSPTSANDPETLLRGELEGVFWVSATKSDGGVMTALDTITDANGAIYRLFQNAHRTERYSYLALKEA